MKKKQLIIIVMTTQQKNHLSELGFVILDNRGRDLMHADIIPIKLRYKLFEEKDRHIDGPTIGYRYQLKKGTRYNH